MKPSITLCNFMPCNGLFGCVQILEGQVRDKEKQLVAYQAQVEAAAGQAGVIKDLENMVTYYKQQLEGALGDMKMLEGVSSLGQCGWAHLVRSKEVILGRVLGSAQGVGSAWEECGCLDKEETMIYQVLGGSLNG